MEDVINRFWTCDDPKDPRKGSCYDTLRPAIAGARLRNQYVVVETYVFETGRVVMKPSRTEDTNHVREEE